ncbi:hypothetical protein BKA69DRAFT_1089224 [Paraphysoderma sedebokerense]|nr:hypothetical protein BKA69DRAFT_1089224 [Paraphysoderma sedebokerense]
MSPPQGCQDEGKEMSRRNVLIQTDDDRVVATKSDTKGDAVLPPEGCQDEGKETSRRNVLIQTDDDQVVATKNDIKGDAVLPLAKMKEMNQSMDMENQEFQAAVTEAVDTDTKKRFVSRLARFISARKVWKKASTQDVAVQQLAQNESSCVLDCNTITEACEFGRAETQGLKSDRVKKAKKRGASARVKLFISKKIMRQKHSK